MKWEEGEERVCKVVFIGKDLDRKIIEEGFDNAVYDSDFEWGSESEGDEDDEDEEEQQ